MLNNFTFPGSWLWSKHISLTTRAWPSFDVDNRTLKGQPPAEVLKRIVVNNQQRNIVKIITYISMLLWNFASLLQNIKLGTTPDH